MRRLAGLALIVSCAVAAAPAVAQTGLLDQLNAASRAFMADLGPGEMTTGRYQEAIAEGLSGTWVARNMLGAYADPGAFANALGQACASSPTTITTPRPFAITIEDGRADRAIRVDYVYVGGVTFAPLFDLDAFLRRQGSPATPDLPAIRSATEPIAIYRPSPDILVLARALAEPLILLRCGSQTAAPGAAPPSIAPPASGPGVSSEALEAALGRSFDEQFRTADPAVRAQFIACARAAMTPLSPADLDLLVTTNFKPADAELRRIQQDYPTVSEGAQACARAAEAALRQ